MKKRKAKIMIGHISELPNMATIQAVDPCSLVDKKFFTVYLSNEAIDKGFDDSGNKAFPFPMKFFLK